jgi:hypothetical protein
MNINIISNGEPSNQTSNILKSLGDDIEKGCGVLVKQVLVSHDGYKDGGLVIGLSVAGLALSAISTLVAVLGYRESKQVATKEKYSFSFVINNKTYAIENLNSDAFKSILESDLKMIEDSEGELEIQIISR